MAFDNVHPHINAHATVAGNQVTNNNPLPVAISPQFGDAFGRQRISEPLTLFDSKQLYDNAPLFWDEALESGGGISAAHSVNEAATTFTSTDSTAGVFTRQTFQAFNYQPGKSQLILMTGVLSASGGGAGVQRRIGQFNDNNGVFFEDDEGTIKVVRRSYVTGSAVDTKAAQSDWNLDKLDGTGTSGITLDTSKANIFVIDYEWLGVGRVYMSTPNLPLRYQMVTTASSPVSTMKAICSSVISEGGSEDNGIIRGASTGGTHVDANAADTVYALIGVRLKAAYPGAVIKQMSHSVLAETNDNFEWIIYLNPTVAGTFTYSDVANSAVQTATGATANTVTGGTILNCGFSASQTGFTEDSLSSRWPGVAIDGTVDEIVLCARPLSSNADIQASLNWRELQ